MRLNRSSRIIFLQLQFIDTISKFFYHFVICKQFLYRVKHKLFQPFFFYRLFVAFVLFGVVALIVAVLPRGVARPDNTRHHRATFAAKELCGEQIIVLAPVHSGSFFIPRHTLLHAVESFFVYNCGNGVGNYYVAELVFADILAVGENAKHGVILHLKTLMLNSALVEKFGNVIYAHTVEVERKNFLNDGRERFVDLVVVSIIHIIAEWRAHAVAFCFERIFRHPSLYLFGKLGGIVLGIAFEDRFKQNAVRPLRDTFFGGDDAHTVLFEHVFIVGGIVAVAGKAVELPDNDAVEHTLVAIFNHLLKVGAVVRLGRLRPVYVVADGFYIVEVGVVHTLAELPFNTRLILFFR